MACGLSDQDITEEEYYAHMDDFLVGVYGPGGQVFSVFPVFSMMGNFPVIRTELRLLFEKNFPIRNFPVIRTEQTGAPM